MKTLMRSVALGLVLAGGMPALMAEEDAKSLPTLLIKGEVVSLDTNDLTAILLKVRDRYGFETPLYLTQETAVTQGDATLDPAGLEIGAAVEVEYNFDVNTAKRHAVAVRLEAPEAAEEPSALEGALPAPAPGIEMAAEAGDVAEAQEAAPAEQAESAAESAASEEDVSPVGP